MISHQWEVLNSSRIITTCSITVFSTSLKFNPLINKPGLHKNPCLESTNTQRIGIIILSNCYYSMDELQNINDSRGKGEANWWGFCSINLKRLLKHITIYLKGKDWFACIEGSMSKRTGLSSSETFLLACIINWYAWRV